METSVGNVRAPSVDEATTSKTLDAERHKLNLGDIFIFDNTEVKAEIDQPIMHCIT